MPKAVAVKGNVLSYKGSAYLRQRLVLAVLSGKSVKIEDIRKYDIDPGIQEFEVNLVRLLDKVTNGSYIKLDETGTSLFFQPGMIHGGTIEHDCSLDRSIGYYLEVLILLAPFCKNPLHVTLKGVTNNKIDPSVDHIKASVLPVLRKFMLNDEGLELKILKRGMRPLGGGEVVFKCPIQNQLNPVHILNQGKVKRIRGTAYAVRVSPTMANRMVEAAKGVLLKFIPDVFVTTDHCRGKQSGNSPGFGIHLVAETTEGVFYSAEAISNLVAEDKEPSVAEDVGVTAAQRLLIEIYQGGCVDSVAQSIACVFMTLGQKNVSRIIVGSLTDYTIAFLRNIRDFFGITFKVDYYIEEDSNPEEQEGAPKISLICIGAGYTNLNKRYL
ncbi:probable RNA 3'-terminal phosphate cyclase-like protein [Agrilus planipennis]|uniref:Probable RNA 3'-terminal phosphate cyclase-like protein n=1 Tax=Agrilus planipennis TaxID=224129 RepID=A0A1W4WM25_AGRPL|nr:probable RNA 3'-terminal phosphate cyclase-like protein [Agrilus planipennis]